MKTKIAGVIAACSLMLGLPAVASAEYGMHSYEAQAANDSAAAGRCSWAWYYAFPGGFCANQKTSGAVYGGDGWSWYVSTTFDIATWTGTPQLRHCQYIGHWHEWQPVFIYVTPGC